MQDEKTIRRQMIELLGGDRGAGARELSRALHIPEREVYGHLEHIARSLKTRGLRLEVEPARCLDCGFVFRKRTKLAPPGHCPGCRGSHLQRPRYRIVVR
ncbi:MAG TPA: transcriptional regulator [Desulfobulbus sp.]|nr:transcriptional regulator [Desulfobulbus sp.]